MRAARCWRAMSGCLYQNTIVRRLSEHESNTIRTIKGSFVRNVVDQKNTHRSTVVSGCNRAESLLSCCIPLETSENYNSLNWIFTYNLELDTLAIKLDGPNLEVYTNGGDERGGPGIVTEP